MLPNVKVNLLNGQLGTQPQNTDGIIGIMISGTATSEIALLQAKVIYGMAGLTALGITSSNNPSAYRHVSDFYSEGREGLELWIMLTNPTLSMADCANKNNNFAKKLIIDAGRRIKVLGITRKPAGGYTPTITNGLDVDSYNALQKAHELCEYFAGDTENAPIRALVEARSFNDDETNLLDLNTVAYNRAGLLLMSSTADGSASVGLALGRMAGNSLQVKISRVKDGALPINACFAGTHAIASYPGISLIHDKGYITARTFPGKTGYYFTSDRTATAETDDYATFCHGRVVDKAHRIAYAVYVEELDDDIDVDDDGRISPGVLKNLEATMETAVNLQMSGQISKFDCLIDPNQNVISLGKTVIGASVTPKGYNSAIEVNLGFKNPALNN